MDTPTRRDYTFASDRLGPGTRARLRLTRRGIGGQYALLGNPVSVTVDPVLGCLPWLSLRGGTDASSNAVRQGVLEGDNSPGGTAYGLPGSGGASSGSSSSSSPADAPSPTPVSSYNAGPFAYIGASKTGSY